MIYSQRGINGISTPFVFCFFVYIWYAANTVMIENKYIFSY